MLDLDKFKGKTLDGETLSALESAITSHTDALEARATKAEEKARAAAKESIEGRKGKDAIIAKALEKLGIESADELDDLPDSKGQAEAVKQYEAKLKRAERDLAEKSKALDELGAKYAGEKRERAIAQAVAKHPFIDADDARALIGSRVRQEGDDFLFEGEGGKLVPLDDGAAWFAKTKAHLVRPAGDGSQGSGFKGNNEGRGLKTLTRSAFDALDPSAKAAAIKERVQITEA